MLWNVKSTLKALSSTLKALSSSTSLFLSANHRSSFFDDGV
jgi:hypothetical protein